MDNGGRARTSRGRFRHRLAALAIASLLAGAGCLGGGTDAAEPAPRAKISVPASSESEEWRPDKAIPVTANGGRVTQVSVQTTGGDEVAGRYDAKRDVWQPQWTLKTDTEYHLRAIAVNSDGRKTTKKATFRTLDPESPVRIDSVNASGDSYGVGLPIVLRFSEPVENKKKVERALEVRTSEPITGAWHWMSDEEVHFRPKEHWPTGTDVHLIAHIDGVRAGDDMYGDDNLWTKFEIGDKHVTTVDTDDHEMTVTSDGEVVKEIPISAGDQEHPSSSGTFAAMQPQRHVVMDSESTGVPAGSADSYRIDSYWNIRYTWSGQFVHAAPWSVSAQGERNVSHGCINASTANAKWFYKFTQPGDIIKVTGTPRDVEWGNGWTDWEMSFDDYLDGSAIGEPVHTLTMDGEPRTQTR